MLLQADTETEYKKTVNFNGHTIVTNLHYLYQMTTMLNNGFSVLVFICGKQRMGKSKVGVWHTLFFNKIFNKPIIKDFSKTAYYDPEKIIGNIEHRSCVMIDEASTLFSRRQWWRVTNNAMNDILNSQQNKNFAFFMIAPFFCDMDNAITKHFDYVIRLYGRGMFKVFKVSKKYDAINVKDATWRYFMDECYMSNYEVPDDIWAAYEKYSFAQKELLRQRSKRQVSMSIDNDLDFLTATGKNKEVDIYG